MEPKKKPNLPFYALPQNVKTSAKIVNEARSSIRTLEAKRPFTPLDNKRTLFTSQSQQLDTDARPQTTLRLVILLGGCICLLFSYYSNSTPQMTIIKLLMFFDVKHLATATESCI